MESANTVTSPPTFGRSGTGLRTMDTETGILVIFTGAKFRQAFCSGLVKGGLLDLEATSGGMFSRVDSGAEVLFLNSRIGDFC